MAATSLYARITAQIVAEIEAGAAKFRMPWQRWGELGAPVNAVTGRAYRGMNTLLLWAAAEAAGYSCGRWGTYRQWFAAGAQVRKGERATPVIYWKSWEAASQPDANEDGSVSSASRFFARHHNLFNADQVDGADQLCPRPAQSGEVRIAAAETFFAAIGADVRPGGDQACYVPSDDFIRIPTFGQFRDPQSYYATLAHECVHWTGAKHRLDRELGVRFGGEAYALEELVAELGAAFLSAHLGLACEPRRDHAPYIGSWLKVLKGDTRAVLTVASQAQTAVDYLIERAYTALNGHSARLPVPSGIPSTPCGGRAGLSEAGQSLPSRA